MYVSLYGSFTIIYILQGGNWKSQDGLRRGRRRHSRWDGQLSFPSLGVSLLKRQQCFKGQQHHKGKQHYKRTALPHTEQQHLTFIQKLQLLQFGYCTWPCCYFNNTYRHFWAPLKFIILSVKCQKIVKNAHYDLTDCSQLTISKPNRFNKICSVLSY